MRYQNTSIKVLPPQKALNTFNLKKIISSVPVCAFQRKHSVVRGGLNAASPASMMGIGSLADVKQFPGTLA